MTASTVIEYTAGDDLWKVQRFDLLQAEFPDVTEPRLPAFHDAVRANPRAWKIVSGLFGIEPLILTFDAKPDDYRLISRQDMMDELGVNRAQLGAELDAIRGAISRIEDPVEVVAEPPAEIPQDPQQVLDFNDGELLDRFGFEPGMFDLPGRDPGDNRKEREWFISRVRGWVKMLENPMAATLANQTLRNELHLRRLEHALCRLPPTSKEFGPIANRKSDIESTYQRQLKQLDEVAPWMGAIGNKLSFSGMVADLVRGHWEYYLDGSRKLIDGISTAAEVRFELRRSKQIPEPRYRAGLVAHLNAAKAHLWDAHWKSEFKPEELRALDRAFRATAAAALLEEGVPVPDLESNKSDGEYV